MAVLSNADRAALWAQLMADASSELDVLPVNKVDLRAAIDAVDTWVDSNAASYNTAIPQPARAALTTKQKARLLVYVVKRRFEVA